MSFKLSLTDSASLQCGAVCVSKDDTLLSVNFNVYVRSEVFTAVTMKNAIFWDVAPCRSCVNRCFGGTSMRFTLVPRSRIFYPEDGGDTFLRNVGSNKIYTAPHPRDGIFQCVCLTRS
jgi:hypothetical protein